VRTPTGTLEIRGATAHNLRDVDVDVDIPLGVRAARAATEPRTRRR
jgi:excinuclease UvrABC ATPase subunit